MDWDNCHLYKFRHKDKHYSPDTNKMPPAAYAKISIETLLTEKKEKMNYIYDFGDCWDIDIVLEKILPDNEVKSPVYVNGEMAAPTEDCGGIPVFYYLQEVLNDPKHPEH